MRNFLAPLFICFCWACCSRAPAQTLPTGLETVFPLGQRVHSENFTGHVWVERIVQVGEGNAAVAVGNVTFPPRSRSNWHHHPAGQTLLVLDGVGYYQERGDSVRVLRQGESVQCPPGVEHWHGAAYDEWFVQLAMTQESAEGRVIWGEPVTEEEYRAGIPLQRMQRDSAERESERYRYIMTVASLNTLARYDELATALEDALDGGLTVNECKEVLVHLYAYTGFPRSIQGLRTLMDVVEDRQGRGIVDEVGREAAPVADSGSKYERGKAVLETLTGRSMDLRSDYGDFAPVIDVFLKEHLFADLFERDVLSYTEREVAVVGALASMEGVEPMLGGHLGIALQLGVSREEIRRLISVLATTAGDDFARTAYEQLDKR